MNSEIEKLFNELLEKYKESESKNNTKLLDVGLITYRTAEKGLKEEIEEYKFKLNQLLNIR